MLRIGLIGCGGIGAVHARCWFAMKDRVTLAAIADFDTQKAKELATGCGATVYNDAVEMMKREKLDVVDVCLPTFLHAKYVTEAMNYTKRIIVEKPICLKEDEAQKLTDAQKHWGATVLVGHVLRFFDSYKYLSCLVREGTYGKIKEGYFYRVSGKPVWVKDYDNADKTGGMPIDLHIHDVDFIRHIMGGDPCDIYSTVMRDDRGVTNHIQSTYVYKDAVITSESAWNYPTSMMLKSGCRVLLEKAAVTISDEGIVTVYPEGSESYIPSLGEKDIVDSGINLSDISGFHKELSCFVDYFEGKRNDGVVTLADAVGAFRLVNKELKSAKLITRGGCI